MLFRFKGDYTGGRSSITLFGVTFEGREPADVTDADGICRLSNHPEFEQVTKTVTPEPKSIVIGDRTNAAIAAINFRSAEAPKPKRGRPRKGS